MTSILSFESTDHSASAGIKRSIRCLVPAKTCLKGCQALYISAFTDYLGWGQEETHPRAQRTVNRLYDFFSLWRHGDYWGSCFSIGIFLFLLSFAEALSTWSSSETLRVKALEIQNGIDTCISVWKYLSIQWNLKKKKNQFLNWKFKFSILKSREGLHSSALASKMIALKDITTEPCCPLSRERLSMACHSSPVLKGFHALSDRRLACKGQRRKT